MVFNVTGADSIIDDITFRTGVDLTQFFLADRVRYANEAMSIIAMIIIQADGRMKWDDPNHTDAPISQTNIIKNQQRYNIFSAAPAVLQDWLELKRVEVLDEAGNGIELKPIDEKDLTSEALSEFQDTPGIPEWFDMDGTEAVLYPAANYNYTLGMTFYFNRCPSYFSVSDTTKRPGIPTIFHPFISIYAAHIWNSTKKKDFSLLSEVSKYIGVPDQFGKYSGGMIGNFYSRRPAKYETPVLSNRRPKLMK